MAKLYLKFEQAVLKEVNLTQATLTIGRLPDNLLQIDNLAVSGHHAKIGWEQDHYTIEDLGSLNGTYVNNQRVAKMALKDGDQVAIGKHLVTFEDKGHKVIPAAPPRKAAPNLEATVMLDTRQAQEMIASHTAGNSGPSPATSAKERVGLLNVLEGKTDQPQYVLTGKMTMIGKSDMASIKLKGMFAPESAALISRRDNKYFVSPSGKKMKINGEDLTGQQELKEGDILEVAGIKAAFSLQE